LQHNYPEIIYRTGDIGLVNDRGLIMFKGRRDSLIKHMGYRIELNEIEHIIINVLQLVDNGCSIYDSDKKRIIFIYEAECEIAPEIFKKQLLKKLPKYMIPTVYLRMSMLPRNTNGKIDRAKLKVYKDIM
jgi:acyl-coenzyme A synthetase/AMP-(fatty) acid ligase